MTLEKFIEERPHLIWWTKNYKGLGPEPIVEATLNYGNWKDVQNLIQILGMKKVAEIFRRKSKLSPVGRQNYRPEIIRYFNLYFNKHIGRNA